MIATIIIVTLAFGYLLFETHGLTIRLQTGKDKQYTDNWTPYYKELLEDVEDNSWRIKQEADKVYYKEHTCPICKNAGATVMVETQTIVAGNSTCHVTGCPVCLEKFCKDIENSQNGKIKASITKTAQLPMFITKERVGSHRITGKGIQCDYETVYHNCLVSKTWLKEHENFEYPEPTIEISINGKDLHVNGNYKKGLIGDFVSQYTTRVKAGKKTVTVVKGGHVENQGGGVYIAINGEVKDGEFCYF